ncbi:MAG: four-carbon acid sugar kinase family protein [Lautropia sp.]|nr:four-carbon acid sugar kinase family protein [Lautropia sp.]
MSGLYLAADDLTGALDSAVAFSKRFGPIPVFLDVPRQSGVEHAAINLGTRDSSPEIAARKSASVLQQLTEAAIPFKKIDSLLRGNWALELAELLREGGFRTCIFAPAFPGQGRITRNGRQYLRAADHTERLLELDPVAEMVRRGLRVARTAPGDEPAPADSGSKQAQVLIADAQSDEELRTVARWGVHQDGPVLWCGSGGLARALSRSEPNRLACVPRPVLAIVGSNHTVSRAQIDYDNTRAPQRRVIAGDDHQNTANAVARAFDTSGSALLTFSLPGGIAAPDAAQQIGLRLAGLLPLVPLPKTLVIAGGETVVSVCRALGATRLDVDAQFAAGVPRSRMADGNWSGIEIFSKSGAFGDATLLHRILEAGSGEN